MLLALPSPISSALAGPPPFNSSGNHATAASPLQPTPPLPAPPPPPDPVGDNIDRPVEFKDGCLREFEGELSGEAPLDCARELLGKARDSVSEERGAGLLRTNLEKVPARLVSFVLTNSGLSSSIPSTTMRVMSPLKEEAAFEQYSRNFLQRES